MGIGGPDPGSPPHPVYSDYGGGKREVLGLRCEDPGARPGFVLTQRSQNGVSSEANASYSSTTRSLCTIKSGMSVTTILTGL